MAGPPRKKPSNVVKSRTAPSLLGAPHGRVHREELPRNRFIELGDVALGNSGRDVITQRVVPGPEELATPEPVLDRELPAIPLLTEVQAPPKPPKLSARKPSMAKPPSLPKRSPLTRPKPMGPPRSVRPGLPKPALPPTMKPPKPPKSERPKPALRGAVKTAKRRKPRK